MGAKIMTVAEYAEHRDVTPATVYSWIRRGTITSERRGNRVLIDVRVADAQLTARGKRVDSPTPADLETYDQARARKERAIAALRELELARARKELIPRTALETTWSRTAAAVKGRILAIPDRLASELAEESEEPIVREILAEALREALEILADDLAPLPPPDRPTKSGPAPSPDATPRKKPLHRP